mgnify:CR=1 FL=1
MSLENDDEAELAKGRDVALEEDAGFALAAAFLNAAFGFCLGCEMFLLVKRVLNRAFEDLSMRKVAANAVRVVHRRTGQIVVDHHAQTRQIDAARRAGAESAAR